MSENNAIPMASMLIEATDGGSLQRLATAVTAFANKPQKIKLGVDFSSFDPSKMPMLMAGLSRTVNSGIKSQIQMLKADKNAISEALSNPQKAIESFASNVVSAMPAALISPQMNTALRQIAGSWSSTLFSKFQQDIAKDSGKAASQIAKNMAVVLKHGTNTQQSHADISATAIVAEKSGAASSVTEGSYKRAVAKLIEREHKQAVANGMSQRAALEFATDAGINLINQHKIPVENPIRFAKSAAAPVRRVVLASEIKERKSQEAAASKSVVDRNQELDAKQKREFDLAQIEEKFAAHQQSGQKKTTSGVIAEVRGQQAAAGKTQRDNAEAIRSQDEKFRKAREKSVFDSQKKEIELASIEEKFAAKQQSDRRAEEDARENKAEKGSRKLDRGSDLRSHYGLKLKEAKEGYDAVAAIAKTPYDLAKAESQLENKQAKILGEFVAKLEKEIKAKGVEPKTATTGAVSSGEALAKKHLVSANVQRVAFEDARRRKDAVAVAVTESVVAPADVYGPASPSAAQIAKNNKSIEQENKKQDAKDTREHKDRLRQLSPTILNKRYDQETRSLSGNRALEAALTLDKVILKEIDNAVVGMASDRAEKVKKTLRQNLNDARRRHTDPRHPLIPESDLAGNAEYAEGIMGSRTGQRIGTRQVLDRAEAFRKQRTEERDRIDETLRKTPNHPDAAQLRIDRTYATVDLAKNEAATKKILALHKEDEKIVERVNKGYGSGIWGQLKQKLDADALLTNQRKRESISNPKQSSLESAHNMNFAMMNAAYGFQDFFQVLAQPGMGVSRAFLAAANNIGPALGVLAGSAVGANVAVGGLLAGMAVLNMIMGKGDDKAKQEADSIEKLANAMRSLTQASLDARGALRSSGSDPGVSGFSSVMQKNSGIESRGLGFSRAIQRQGIQAPKDTRDHWSDRIPFYGEGQSIVGKMGSNIAESFGRTFDTSRYRATKNESQTLREAPLSFAQLQQKYPARKEVKSVNGVNEIVATEPELRSAGDMATRLMTRKRRQEAEKRHEEFVKQGGMAEKIEASIAEHNVAIAASEEIKRAAVSAPERVVSNIAGIKQRSAGYGPAGHGMFRESIRNAVGAQKIANAGSELAGAKLSEFEASGGAEIAAMKAKIKKNDDAVNEARIRGADNAEDLASRLSLENQEMEKRLVLLEKEQVSLTKQKEAADAVSVAMAKATEKISAIPGAARHLREAMFPDAKAAESANVGGYYEKGVFGGKTGKQLNFADRAKELKKKLEESVEDDGLDEAARYAKRAKYHKDLIAEAASFAGEASGKTQIIESGSLWQRIQESLTANPATQIEERQLDALNAILEELRSGRDVSDARLEKGLTGGFDSGGYAGGGKKPSSRDVIPAMLRLGEAVVTPERQAEIAHALGINPFTLFGTAGANGLKMKRGKSFSEWAKFGQARGFDEGGTVSKRDSAEDRLNEAVERGPYFEQSVRLNAERDRDEAILRQEYFTKNAHNPNYSVKDDKDFLLDRDVQRLHYSRLIFGKAPLSEKVARRRIKFGRLGSGVKRNELKQEQLDSDSAIPQLFENGGMVRGFDGGGLIGGLGPGSLYEGAGARETQRHRDRKMAEKAGRYPNIFRAKQQKSAMTAATEFEAQSREYHRWKKRDNERQNLLTDSMGKVEQEFPFQKRRDKYSVQSGRLGMSGFYRNQWQPLTSGKKSTSTWTPSSGVPSHEEAWPNGYPTISSQGPLRKDSLFEGGAKLHGVRLNEHLEGDTGVSDKARQSLQSSYDRVTGDYAISKYRKEGGGVNRGIANRLEISKMEREEFSTKAIEAQKRMHDRQNKPQIDTKESSEKKRASLLSGLVFDKKQAYLDKRSAGWSKEEAQKFADEEEEKSQSPVEVPKYQRVGPANRRNPYMTPVESASGKPWKPLNEENEARLKKLEEESPTGGSTVLGGDRGKRLREGFEDDKSMKKEGSKLQMDAWKNYFDELPGKLQNVTGDEQVRAGGIKYDSGENQNAMLLKQAVDLLSKMLDVSGEHSAKIVEAVRDSGISIG